MPKNEQNYLSSCLCTCFPEEQIHWLNYLVKTYVLRLVQRRDANCLQIVQKGGVKVLQPSAGVDDFVLHEDADGSEHEGHEQVHVDVVPGAAKTPGKNTKKKNYNHCSYCF